MQGKKLMLTRSLSSTDLQPESESRGCCHSAASWFCDSVALWVRSTAKANGGKGSTQP